VLRPSWLSWMHTHKWEGGEGHGSRRGIWGGGGGKGGDGQGLQPADWVWAGCGWWAHITDA